jgi:hypothetical protein
MVMKAAVLNPLCSTYPTNWGLRKLAVAAHNPGLARLTRKLRSGFEDPSVGGNCDERTDDQREAEDAAPTERVDEDAAKKRSDHGAEGVKHRQIRDGTHQILGAISIARDRADQRHAAARAYRLDDPPEGKRGGAGRHRGNRAAEEKQQEPGEKQRTPAVAVGEAPVGEGGQGHGKQRNAEIELCRRLGESKRHLHGRDDRKEEMHGKWRDECDEAERQGKGGPWHLRARFFLDHRVVTSVFRLLRTCRVGKGALLRGVPTRGRAAVSNRVGTARERG